MLMPLASATSLVASSSELPSPRNSHTSPATLIASEAEGCRQLVGCDGERLIPRVGGRCGARGVVGGGCQHGGVAGQRSLRRIGDPVVAAAPGGVRIRTRIRVTEAEAAALRAIGMFLGSVYRGELADRIRGGVLDRAGRAEWRAGRKQAITAVSSSRWAGAITRCVEDQYQLGMRGLGAHVSDLRAALAVLTARCALRPGEHAAEPPISSACGDAVGPGGGMPAPPSGSPRPGDWRFWVNASLPPSVRWRRGTHRW